MTAAVASVAPPSVAATSTPSEEAETSTSPTTTSPTTATVASAGARPGSAASRSNFVSKLPAPPPLSARNPKDGPQKPKGGTRANQNSRLASTFGRDAPAGPAARGAGDGSSGREGSIHHVGGVQGAGAEGDRGVGEPGPPISRRGNGRQGGTKKATYRDRIASGRRAATATATATTTTATTEQPAAAPLGPSAPLIRTGRRRRPRAVRDARQAETPRGRRG